MVVVVVVAIFQMTSSLLLYTFYLIFAIFRVMFWVLFIYFAESVNNLT